MARSVARDRQPTEGASMSEQDRYIPGVPCWVDTTQADPAGASFCVWQPGQHRGAAIVNEHASLNFNVLNTPDLDAAAAFYGAVFGWELLDVDGSPMWALPAYGDFLERRTPGLRENIATMGAPKRFEEVVAAATPITGDQPGVQPHWAVTFAVDDAD